ncbi:unnamed protein product [Leptosia nina]|uniref:PAP-associated domain-containing protein n=1 Tax=Leptosia nina TaxID=320188 RepID=A0AAV1J1B9_9NEOP
MHSILNTSHLTFTGNFDTQAKAILAYIRMTQQEIEKLQLLFNDLQDIFGNTWKGSTLEVFGSIVTGLALRSSDVDCLVNLPPWLDMPRASFVIEARKILRRNNRFQKIFAITKAKVPIVQFEYAPTRTRCDVSFSTRAAVVNSKLLEYLIFCDERILPFAILVKYWSKIQHFTGTNLMSSYSLILLVLFYLQQKHILPPIMAIQHNIQEHIVDNWNTAFEKTITKSNNNESLYTLFGGFFKYYEGLNFKKHVISLYTGELIDREKFSTLESIPEEFYLYKKNVSKNISQPLRLDTTMCIQDPFNHGRNCAVGIYFKLAQKIIGLFDRASVIYETEPESSFLRTLLYCEEIPRQNIPQRANLTWNKSAKNHGIQKNHKHQLQNRQFKQRCKQLNQNTNKYHRNQWT